MAARRTASGRAASDRDDIRHWIELIEAQHKVSKAEIAKRAGLPASTVYRWIDEDGTIMPSYAKLRQIAEAFGVDMPGAQAPAGFQEGDASPYQGPENASIINPNQSNWLVSTRALELAGIMPGDIVLVDQTEMPRTHDIVIAQVYNLERGTAETKLRMYTPPYLTTLTMDPATQDRPLFVDNERVVIAGVITMLTQLRKN